MTKRTGTELSLTRLSDSEFILEDRTQDVRGLDVYDDNGDEIGNVEDLYVDTEERKVRFLDVAAGGFLGLGEKRFLIPVEVIREVTEDRLVVDQSREKVAGSPPFSTDVVPAPSHQRQVYDYFGHTGAPRSRTSGRSEPWR